MTVDYPVEVLDADEDDGTMVESLKNFSEAVIGHKIVGVEFLPTANRYGSRTEKDMVIKLDDGKRVRMIGNADCCAYTDVEEFLLNAEKVDNMILGVGTTDNYTTWHVFADAGDIMQLKVGWSCGNPFYYMYGFTINVEEITGE